MAEAAILNSMTAKKATYKTARKPFTVKGREFPSVYDDGYLHVEHDHFYVECGGQTITLTLKLFKILSCLISRHPCPVSTDELWEFVWDGGSKSFNSNTLRVHVHRLRRLLAPFSIRVECHSEEEIGYHLLFTPRHTGEAISSLSHTMTEKELK